MATSSFSLIEILIHILNLNLGTIFLETDLKETTKYALE
jgi:hypothetical protein